MVVPAPVDAASNVASLPHEDFESAAIGAMPEGWTPDAKNDGVAFAVAPGDGGAGHVLEAVISGTGRGRIVRAFDATAWRGRRLVLSARAQATVGIWWSRGLIGFDVKRPVLAPWSDEPRSYRVVEPAWRSYAAIVDVAPDATSIELVISAAGPGTYRVDDLVVGDVGPAGGDDAPPAPLTGRALDNVVAFARLCGLVRYFHPSDEAAALDADAWERFVVRGVGAVEPAADATALAATLSELFAPLAPTAQVYLDGEAPEIAKRELPAGATKVTWSHSGLGISANSLYRSSRGLPGSTGVMYTTLTTPIDISLVRGKSIRLRLRVKAKLDAGEDVGLWAVASRADGSPSFYTEPELLPEPGTDWTLIEATGTVGTDAEQFYVGFQVIGDVEAWVEPPTLEVLDGERSTAITVPDWGTAGKPAAPWGRWGREEDDVAANVGTKGCAKKRTCLAVASVARKPASEVPWEGSLAGGVSARVPVVLWTDGTHTIPVATATTPAADAMPLLVTDRATRLASVIIAWNIPQHFYPYFDVTNVDWPGELRVALGDAANDAGPEPFIHTLRRLYGALDDGHGYVTHVDEPTSHMPPWAWDIVEGELVITRVADACGCDLKPGDVVTVIDGVPAPEVVAAAREEVSAATPQFRDHLVANNLGKGGEGDRTRIEVRRDGQVHAVEAAYVAVADVGKVLLKEPRPADGAEVAPGIRYLDLDATDAARFEAALPELAKADVVIFDLRGYPDDATGLAIAHIIDRAVSSPQWHIPRVPRPDRDEMTFSQSSWDIAPIAPRIKRAIFLTDGRAVSAAETNMGIVEGHQLAEIVGSPTAGTNGNINPFTVPGGYTLWFTGMKVLKHDGSRHHGVGIQPTVLVEPTIAGIAAGRDEVLEKAIEVAQKPARKLKKQKPAKKR